MPDGSDDEGDNHGGSQLRVYAGLAHAADPVVGGRFPSVAEGLAYKYPFTREPYPVDDVLYQEGPIPVPRYVMPYASPSVRLCSCLLACLRHAYVG